jgi:hypothetical protein
MKINLEFARWFTNEDHEKLKSIIQYNNEKNNQENQLSWLQYHSDEVFKMHSDYYEKQYTKQKKEHIEKIINAEIKNKKIDRIKNGGIEYCICGSELRYIQSHDFVGCKDFSNKTIKHTYLNYSNWHIEKNFDGPTISKNYLSEICKQINEKYKIKIQASNLFEFLDLNQISILTYGITRDKFKIGVDAHSLSKKRELIIKSILEQNNIRFGYQKKIMYKIKDQVQTHAIPDFIVIKNNDIYIIEQKKHAENISEYQVELYKDLINFMHPNKNVQIVFVIEQELESECIWTNHKVLSVNEFKTFISCI